ncbi:MAG: TAXI family TRAP transporter solute-binding subunit, partial [Oscillospiraceae bacterium]|nr:TAXI family TRAP transporter solute-binding subunit [Oscillospiraceae bacterium]
MKMKKILALSMAAVMALALAACGGSAGGDTGSGDAGGTVSLKMATGGTSGTYYGFSGVVAQVLNEKIPDALNITVESTGASAANIDLIDTNGDQIAIVQNDVMYYAATGTDMYDGKTPIDSYSAVMSCYPEYVQIVANKSITSIDQLKGKKV